eukprot:6201693-Pleurochrysis_carterae.AAC.1
MGDLLVKAIRFIPCTPFFITGRSDIGRNEGVQHLAAQAVHGGAAKTRLARKLRRRTDERILHRRARRPQMRGGRNPRDRRRPAEK